MGQKQVNNVPESNSSKSSEKLNTIKNELKKHENKKTERGNIIKCRALACSPRGLRTL